VSRHEGATRRRKSPSARRREAQMRTIHEALGEKGAKRREGRFDALRFADAIFNVPSAMAESRKENHELA